MKNIYITDLSLSDYSKKIWNSFANDNIMSIATARTYMKTSNSQYTSSAFDDCRVIKPSENYSIVMQVE